MLKKFWLSGRLASIVAHSRKKTMQKPGNRLYWLYWLYWLYYPPNLRCRHPAVCSRAMRACTDMTTISQANTMASTHVVYAIVNGF
jgi:hypothetical protein